MLQVKDTETDKTSHFDCLQNLCNYYWLLMDEIEVDRKAFEDEMLDKDNIDMLEAIIYSTLANRFIVTHVDLEESEGEAIELDESYLLLRLSEEDVTQVLYHYGFHDLEVSIGGDPTVTFVDGYELSDLTGGCHIEIKGWLSYTEGWHEKREEVMRAAISQSIQDIANAKKGRVNHFAFL